MTEEKTWKVSEVNSAMREIIENSLLPLWMRGEISTINTHRSGHVYMTMKDERSSIKAVYFGGAAEARRLRLDTGVEIEAFGKLTVYEARGEYQFSVKTIRPLGVGELQRRFEELKAALAKEGLFDAARKKRIPALPREIGVVTSPGGAAIRDFLQIINRRFPNVRIKIYPAAVQGKGAEKELARGVWFFNQKCPVDVIIVTRGGGSLEDLWPFNEEVLAREIGASSIPVISAVGHEIDFTICDFVADLRVPTPSAAAELVIGRREELEEKLGNFRRRLLSNLRLHAATLARRVERAAGSHVFKEPARLAREKQQTVDGLMDKIEGLARNSLERGKSRREKCEARLHAMNPLSVLKRGYSIISDAATGRTITRADEAPEGALLRGVLAEGEIQMVSRGTGGIAK